MSTPPVFDAVVVGSGFAGAVMAERLAAAGRSVLVIERRQHIGGNAYDETDAHGHLIHPYGPHIFHSNSREVVDYLSRFTTWRDYQHRVLVRYDGGLLPFPINRATINRVFGLSLAADEVAAFIATQQERRDPVASSEDVVLNSVGRRLYEAFFRGYTRKQWGVDPSQLDAMVTARIPLRHDDDDRYFTDTFQCMPADGYHAMFRRMLDHPRIRVETGTAWHPGRHRRLARHVVWTGPLDEYFGRHLGPLPYRSIRFEHEWRPDDRAQPVAVVNEPDEAVPFTRTTEFKHFTGSSAAGTSLVREYPQAEGDPYYPIPAQATRALADAYRKLAADETGTTFVGRLAQYRYFNMDQVVGAALVHARSITHAP